MRKELSRLVGAEHVLQAPPSSPYNSDSSRRRGLTGRAQAVVRPGTAEEVAAVLGWCYAHDVPLVARGGGTGVSGGAVPMEGGVVCSLERLSSVRELEPALWRMFPEAGVSTRDVQRLARENGLFFGPDPGAAEQSQIGGNVATNAGGPHALKYGVTGAWVAGLEVVLAPGELIEIGGWVRKDVAGYDLKSLLIGSEGTLGVITAVRLRLLPAPEAAVVLVVLLGDARGGLRGDHRTARGGGAPVGARLHRRRDACGAARAGIPGRGACRRRRAFALIVEVDGSSAEVRAQRESVLAALGARRSRSRSRPMRRRCGAGGTESTRRVTGARGAKVSEDVVFPVERLGAGAGALRGDRRRRTVCARARGATAARATFTRRCWSTRRASRSWTRRTRSWRSSSRLSSSSAGRSRESTGWAG